MKCPQCGLEGLRYKERNIRNAGKTGKARITYKESQATFCRKCGYEEYEEIQ